MSEGFSVVLNLVTPFPCQLHTQVNPDPGLNSLHYHPHGITGGVAVILITSRFATFLVDPHCWGPAPPNFPSTLAPHHQHTTFT